MVTIKSLLKQLAERFLHNEGYFERFWFVFAFFIFTVLLGYILEQSVLTRVGYFLLPLVILLVVLVNGSLYLQDIYEIKDFSKTFNYLLTALIGFGVVTLKISGGKKVLDTNEVNTLDRIGGPGTINVEPGNAVVLETLVYPTRVLGAGEHRVSRGEIIKDVVSLEEYYGNIPVILVTTNDGIDVKITDVEYRFCIDQIKHEDGLRSLKNPYPFSVRAVQNLAYDRNAGADGKIAPWPDAIQGIVKGIISEHIANRDLDMLTSPNILEQHPLDDLRKNFDLPKNRNKFKAVGTNLLWINIGNFSVVCEDVDKQLLGVWSARQSGSAKVMRAQGESEHIASRERGRAEGQVVLLKSIAQALQDINIGSKNDEARTAKNLWNIVLARTAQILESMSSIYFNDEKDGHNGS